MSNVRVSHRETLWEQGHHAGATVVLAATTGAGVAVLLDLAMFDTVTLFFDLAFVLVCAGAALAVRRQDFFRLALFPPGLMVLTILVLVLDARDVGARPGDSLVQALVSGLAHHAGALVAGYLLTLAILALRQIALRHAGMLREPGGYDAADDGTDEVEKVDRAAVRTAPSRGTDRQLRARSR